MASWRAIHRGICTSSRFVTLEEWEQLLFVQMVVQADQWGRLKADPLQIKMMCCPASSRGTEEILSALSKMSEPGRRLVDYYETDGTPVCEILEWDETQPSAYLKGRGPSSLPEKRSDSVILGFHGIPRNPTLEEKRREETRREETRREETRREYWSPTEPLSLSADRKRPQPTGIDVSAVFALYSDICVPRGFVSHRSLNPTMKKQIRARIRERRPWEGDDGDARSDSIEWWRAYFQACAGSAFLCDNRNVGNLVYITGIENMDKLIAGNFWAQSRSTVSDRNAANAKEALRLLGEAE